MVSGGELNLYEISIEKLIRAYSSGDLSAVAVTAAYLNRVAKFDRAGACLNSIIVLNPDVFDAAAESDRRYQNGTARELEGVPFTVKDSYMVEGLTVAAGSPAFAGLMAKWDAFTVAQLKAAGAILVGKTNMPPMADGGMQRGVYGRAENPYNSDYLAAAYASGSSNGSAVATAANFAVFGMGEETVSSGRSPASNNAVCAYTPSWGVISIRGNWPLFPARDVVVPHTRSMPDMLRVLNVLVVSDKQTRGDFWRHQEVLQLPQPERVRPRDYTELGRDNPLAGKTFAVPKMYLGEDSNFPIRVRPSVLELWRKTADKLTSLGAKLVVTDFPLIEKYEGDKPGSESVADLNMLPEGWMGIEFNHFLAYGWHDFLLANGDPNCPELKNVDPDTIFPLWHGTLPDRYEEVVDYANRYRNVVKYAREGLSNPCEHPDFEAGLRALVRLRKELFEDWLDANGYAGAVFPAIADIGREEAEREMAANDHAWQNGVFYANGNYAIRHLGIPTVTVSMGVCADIGVPAGVTFAGRAYDDNALLAYATQLESASAERALPALAPPSETDSVRLVSRPGGGAAGGVCDAEIVASRVEAVSEGQLRVMIEGALAADIAADVRVWVAGAAAEVSGTESEFTAEVTVQQPDYGRNPDPRKLLGVVLVAGETGTTGKLLELAY
ncbi:amidase [Canibacter sp. lx-72]|uniref:amidase n=1 Tax=Canibacter zhuwentaonis TaxID=2837491 RepID=UPI001BDBD9D4|nr:amidase [Canibacter zhuwentaonis]